MKPSRGVRGRGSASNPKNRFETIERIPEPPEDNDEVPSPLTQFFNDTSKSIIAYNDSPDVGFDASVNPYRGCEHGCIYCYARPTHEYLGFSSGLDFETKIMVKEDAPELLRKELSSAKWKPQVLAMSGVTDCYQPAEKKRQLTRRCLEVLLEFRNPAVIITKNYLVTRDIDIFRELARFQCIGVTISLTTLDAQTVLRYGATGVKPGASISSDQSAGGSRNSSGLPASADDSWSYRFRSAGHRASRCRSRRDLCRLCGAALAVCSEITLRSSGSSNISLIGKKKFLTGFARCGVANSTTRTSRARMRGEGIFAQQMAELFQIACKKAGINKRWPEFTTKHFRRPGFKSPTRPV